MKINKYILKKELLIELKNSSSLFLITPTMAVLIIIFPILSMVFFAVNVCMINIIFQIFTSFNNRFVQFILIVPMYLALSIFIGPLWLGLGQELANIYLLMYLGITIFIFGTTNYYIEKVNLR